MPARGETSLDVKEPDDEPLEEMPIAELTPAEGVKAVKRLLANAERRSHLNNSGLV